MCLPVLDQLCDWRERKKGREKKVSLALLWPEKGLTDSCLSGTHPKNSQWISFPYNSGAFQTAASVLELRVSLCTRTLRAKFVFYSCSALLDACPVGFPGCFPQSSGKLTWLDIPCSCGTLHWGCESWLGWISTLPTYLNVAFSFTCRKSVLLGFRSFSVIVVYVFVILVCPQGNVGLGSFYSAILTIILRDGFITSAISSPGKQFWQEIHD